MSLSLISKLKTLIEEGGSKDRIEGYEDVIEEEIEKYVKEKSFYELPTNEVLKIVGKSEFEDLELLYEVISRMCECKGEESTLLLNVIKCDEATLEDCVKILSKFKYSQLCRRTSKLFFDEKYLPERDIKRETEVPKNKTKEKKTYFPPVTKKPTDFENDIFKAAEKGKLTSIQYLIEQCHVGVETKDNYGNTQINMASNYGQLDVVKYLYEQCHADVETKNNNGRTPINNASYYGHLEVVKYLYETCHADVEIEDKFGNTPINFASLNGHLEVVKYLYDTCRANVEAKDSLGRTPINCASINGHLEIVKYLYETCHVKVTERVISSAKLKCKEYLQSKMK